MSSERVLPSLYRLDYGADDDALTGRRPSAPQNEHPALLLTKLQRPGLPADSVPRPRLATALARILTYPVTLVSAPTGFGKSVLVSQAVADLAAPVAWLNLDEHDNELHTFLGYLIAAIVAQFPTACAQTRLLLDAVSPLPAEPLIASLVNEIQAIPAPSSSSWMTFTISLTPRSPSCS